MIWRSHLLPCSFSAGSLKRTSRLLHRSKRIGGSFIVTQPGDQPDYASRDRNPLQVLDIVYDEHEGLSSALFFTLFVIGALRMVMTSASSPWCVASRGRRQCSRWVNVDTAAPSSIHWLDCRCCCTTISRLMLDIPLTQFPMALLPWCSSQRFHIGISCR